MTAREGLKDFCIVVSTEVAGAACQLAHWLLSRNRTQQSSPRVLGNLGAILGGIAHDLRDWDQTRQNISEHRFHKFLKQLETVCVWPNSLEPSSSYPSLDAIAQHTIAPERLASNLTAWANSGPRKTSAYITSFDKFLPRDRKSKSASLENLYSDLKPLVEEPVPDAVSQRLYETIARHALCACSHDPSGSVRHIQGRLRLIEKTDNNRVSDYLFDTVFITPAEMHQPEPLQCQFMRFYVPTIQQATSVDPNDITSFEDIGQGTLLDVQDFCHLVRHNVGAVKLCLKIRGHRLVNIPRPVPLGDTEYPIQPVPSIPLQKLLGMKHLTTRDRLVVAYILAKSVWQYYNTDWLNALWTTDDIHFMMEEREDDKPEELTLNPARPYLAFADHEHGYPRTSVSESVDCCVNHRFPRILALGVILVELCRQEPQRRVRDNSTLDAFLNNSLLDSSRTMNKDPSWPHLELNTTYRNHFRDAVAICFDWRRLEDISSHGQDPIQAFHNRRDLLWNEVVSRLQLICRILKLIDDNGAVIHGNSHTLDRLALYQSSILNRRADLAALAPQSSRLIALGSASRIDEPAHDWIKQIQKSRLVQILFQSALKSGPCNSRPVRVAILDSGYDANNEFFTSARKQRIKSWRDATMNGECSGEGKDSDGHGTDVLSLALRVAPFAEFFVARVFESSDDVVSRADQIAEAIKWAVEEHDVDMISMSFGFTKDQPAIQAAITEAYSYKKRQIIFFAAAANEGANEREMYPARDDHVFAIRATDHQGNWWKSNPPVDMNKGWSFMTLGRDLPTASGTESVSGTSYATPIAAGLAAMVLAYARRLLYASTQGVDSELLDRLTRQDGMRKVLKKLSVETTPPRCSYLNPMDFIHKEEDERLAMLRYAD